MLMQGSGLDLALEPRIDAGALFILPVLCVILILSFLFKKFNNGWLQILTGLTPILGAIGGLFHVSQRLNAPISEVWPVARPFLDWGVYAAIFTGLFLIISGFVRLRYRE